MFELSHHKVLMALTTESLKGVTNSFRKLVIIAQVFVAIRTNNGKTKR